MVLKFDIEKNPPGSEEINAEKERLNCELTKAQKKRNRLLQAVAFSSLLAVATPFILYLLGMIERDSGIGAIAIILVSVGIAAAGVAVLFGAGLFLFIKIADAIDSLIDNLNLLEPASDELSPEILALCHQNEVVHAYQNALPRPKRPLLQAEYLAMKAWVDGAKSRMAMTEKARQVEAASNQLKQYIELNTAS